MATLLYDNGAPNLAFGNDISFNLIAEDFTLDTNETITNVVFWTLENLADHPNGFTGSIIYAFFSDDGGTPGTLLATGISTNLVRTATGIDFFPEFPEYEISFDVVPFDATAGTTYWLALHNGSLALVGAGVYWESTAGNDTTLGRASQIISFPLNWQNSTREHAFKLYTGTAPPPPGPPGPPGPPEPPAGPVICYGPEYITLVPETGPEAPNYYLEVILTLKDVGEVPEDTHLTAALNGRTFPLESDIMLGLNAIGVIFDLTIVAGNWSLVYEFAQKADVPVTSEDETGPFDAINLGSAAQSLKLRAQWLSRKLTAFVNDDRLNDFSWTGRTFDATGDIAFQYRFQNPSSYAYPILIDSMRGCYLPFSALPPSPPVPPPCPEPGPPRPPPGPDALDPVWRGWYFQVPDIQTVGESVVWFPIANNNKLDQNGINPFPYASEFEMSDWTDQYGYIYLMPILDSAGRRGSFEVTGDVDNYNIEIISGETVDDGFPVSGERALYITRGEQPTVSDSITIIYKLDDVQIGESYTFRITLV